MNKLFSTSVVVIALFSTQAFAEVETIKANVNGMVCAFCAQGIEKKLHSLSQTKDVYVNLKERIVVVEINEGQTLSNDTVKKAIKDAGYDVTSIETIHRPVAQIRSELGAK